MSRTAPYRHEDGSNCWTVGCSRSNFFVGTSAPQFTITDFYEGKVELAPSAVSDAEHAADVKYLQDLLAAPDAKPAKPKAKRSSARGKLPLNSGAVLNERYNFRNRLKVAYDPAKHEPVQNVSPERMTWVKPLGAFWISTADERGTSSWDHLMEGMFASSKTVEHEVKFRADAKVLTIDSRADYDALLAEFPHTVDTSNLTDDERSWLPYGGAVSLLKRDGTAKRGLDYERMSEQYDALFLTRQGLRECGGGNFLQDGDEDDVSLYIWDIESAVVFNPEAIEVQPRV